jgi:uncharacterized coiled-coil DUF342 family protein
MPDLKDLPNLVEKGLIKIKGNINRKDKRPKTSDDIGFLANTIVQEIIAQAHPFLKDQQDKIIHKADDMFKQVKEFSDHIKKEKEAFPLFVEKRLHEMELHLDQRAARCGAGLKDISAGAVGAVNRGIEEGAKSLQKTVDDGVKKLNEDIRVMINPLEERHNSIIASFNKFDRVKTEAIDRIENLDDTIVREMKKIEEHAEAKIVEYLADHFFGLFFKGFVLFLKNLLKRKVKNG